MKTELLSLAALAVSFVSCTGDSSESPSEEQITHFVTSRYIGTGGSFQIQSVIDYTISGGKYDSYITEIFANGQSTGEFADSDFVYENGLLVSHDSGPNRTRNFFYNDQGKLIGANLVIEDQATGNSSTLYYRFVHYPGNVVHCERLVTPFDSPDSEISYRTIMDFDEFDNLESAGRDLNFDGVMENANTFTTINDDIVGVVMDSGASYSFSYSTVVNNENFLAQNSYGKQVVRLLCSESFAIANFEGMKDVFCSRHLFADDLQEAAYEVNENNNFIKKKTLVEQDNTNTSYDIQTVTEYFFE